MPPSGAGGASTLPAPSLPEASAAGASGAPASATGAASDGSDASGAPASPWVPPSPVPPSPPGTPPSPAGGRSQRPMSSFVDEHTWGVGHRLPPPPRQPGTQRLAVVSHTRP